MKTLFKMTLHRILRPVSPILKWRNTISAASFSSKADRNTTHIGIDLGSRFPRVSFAEGDTTRVLFTHPSGIYMSQRHMGICISQGLIDPLMISDWRRLIGRNFNDPIIQDEMKKFPYKIIKAHNGDALIETSSGRRVLPIELFLSALQVAKTEMESSIGKSISRAVLSYPRVMFSDSQLRAVLKAGLDSRVGFDLIHSIDEPTAAAIAYRVNGKEKEGCIIVVVDMGGRTFDVSILQVSSNGWFVSKAPTKSDMFFGGEDFDNILTEYLLSLSIIPPPKDPAGLVLIRGMAELIKIELSTTYEAHTDTPSGSVITITRTKFENLVDHLFEKVRNQIKSCLKEAGITATDVEEVLLIGGMANVPKFQEVVTEIFGKSPSKREFRPEETIALGTAIAIQAGYFGENAWND